MYYMCVYIYIYIYIYVEHRTTPLYAAPFADLGFSGWDFGFSRFRV